MNKRNMELSDKEYIELAEKLDAEQVILEETDIINNQYENLLKNRIILINDTISDLTIDKVVMPLLQMDNDGTGKKITIYINTNGGSVYDGLCLCNIIEGLKQKQRLLYLDMLIRWVVLFLCLVRIIQMLQENVIHLALLLYMVALLMWVVQQAK